MLSVGIKEFKDETINSLKYTEADATALTRVLKSQQGKVFAEVKSYQFLGTQATRPNIEAAMNTIAKLATPPDTVVAYFSTHGQKTGDDYFLLTQDTQFANLSATALSGSKVLEFYKNVNGNTLLLLDTDSSGYLTKELASQSVGLRDARFTKTIVAAATGSQKAWECPALGHGCFTAALIEALDGKASTGPQGVTFNNVLAYLVERVPELARTETRDLQEPSTFSAGVIPTWTLSRPTIVLQPTTDPTLTPPRPTLGGLFLVSSPSGAQVIREGQSLGKTPLTLKDLPPGPVNYTLTLEGYSSTTLQVTVVSGKDLTLNATLITVPKYLLVLSSNVPNARLFVAGQDRGPVLSGQVLTFNSPSPDLEVRAEGYASQPLKLTLTQNKTLRQTVKLERPGSAALLGGLRIISSPSGAQVLQGGKVLGQTPLSLTDLLPGPVTYTFALEGYREATLRGEVRAGQTKALGATLERLSVTPPPPSAPKPQLTLLSPANGSSVSGSSFTLRVQLSGSSDPAPSLSYRLGGQSPRSVGVRLSASEAQSLEVELPDTLEDGQALSLVVQAQASSGSVSPEPLTLKFVYRKPNRFKGVALVLGNQDYSPYRKLDNPRNDATDMAELLTKLGFDVTLELDLGKAGMDRVIDTFGRKLAQNPGISLFYYSGHGVEVNGTNYLVPVDAAFKSRSEVRFKAVSVDYVLSQLDFAKSKTNLLILDACRDNPFAGQSFADDDTKGLSSSRGLSPIDAPEGTLIAYATAPGKTADDGQGRNSPYTRALLKFLPTPKLSITQVLNQVRSEVLSTTNRTQKTWDASSLLGDLYLNP